MKCQHVSNTGPCSNEATRDIRVRAGARGWRLFLCDDHVEESVEELRAVIDRMAVDQDTNSPIEKG